MKNYIELKKEIGTLGNMELWAASAHYEGHVTEGFALCPKEDNLGLGSCDWYESDPRELNDITGGLRLPAYRR